MPRGGRRSASPMRSAPARHPPAPVPHRPPPAPVAAAPHSIAPQPQGPGLMGQMAATAGGVAIGSAVGHMVGHAMTGGGGGRGDQVESAPMAQQPVNYGQPQQQQQPCDFELRQFVDCSQQQYDLTLCEGFNSVLKECRAKYRL